MRFKVIILLILFVGFSSCDDVDTEKLLGIDDTAIVKTNIEKTEDEIELFDKVWEKTYTIDIDKDYPEYAQNIKYIDFKAFLYEVTKFESDGKINSGIVEVVMADQAPEKVNHPSFSNDVTAKKVYRIDNQEKIKVVKDKFEKERKATFLFRVTLDEKPEKPIKMSFKFDFDMIVQGNLVDIKK